MLPEPVDASSVKPVLPGQNSILPEPVSSFQSVVGAPAILMSPEPVCGVQAAVEIFEFDIAGAGLGLHVALAGLVGVDVARAGVHE